jgi:hypothetical protein
VNAGQFDGVSGSITNSEESDADPTSQDKHSRSAHSPQQRRPQGVPPVTPACGAQARFLGSAKPSLQSVVVILRVDSGADELLDEQGNCSS